MQFFANTDELHQVMKELWARIGRDPDMSEKLLQSKLIVQFQYREPEGRVTVDCSDGKEMKVTVGKQPIKPMVEMAMKADVAHDFWLGKVNVPFAIVSGKIMARGPVAKALQLLPVIKPAFDIYPNVISQHKKVLA
ncbi:MAG: SCP2 sterol-binding domain-containing protein [Candidatus Obscuribacterales bacterium]|nr:SCP2 sterol-binding domain-containing protein [Candidatus Obscuribacterales bacterium]